MSTSSQTPPFGIRSVALALLLVFTFSAIALGPAHAQVTSNVDDLAAAPGTLRGEIEGSSAGETIDFQLGTGSSDATVIQLEELLLFDNSLVLDNSDPAFGPATIRSPDDGFLFEIGDGVSVTLRDVGLGTNGQNSADDIDLQFANSTLVFDLTRDDQSVSSAIIGLGSVVKRGASALTLTGENIFTGTLTIEGGDVIGTGDAFQMGAIDLAASGAGATARIVFDVEGSDFFDANSPGIMNTSSGGGIVRFVKRGDGDLDLSGASIAAGIGFDVEAGELVVDDGILAGNNDFDIASGATVDVDIALAQPIYAGTIAGAGTLRTRATDLTLTGNLSNFSGLLDVEDGFLLGVVTIDPDTAPTGPLSFDVQLNSATTSLILEDDVGLTLSGDISGTGDFIVRTTDANPTVLTGQSTNTFRTNLETGTLIGNTSNLRGTIDVNTGATLVFQQAFDANFAGAIGSQLGAITVDKFGAGRLTLTNSQDFAGAFNVREGGLRFGQNVDLLNAANDLVIGSGSGAPVTLSTIYDPATPGGANNTVDIAGDLTLLRDAEVTVDLDDSGSNVRFAVGGAVSIDPATRLFLQLQPGTYTNAPISILTGASVSGDFDIEQNLFFFDVVGVNNGSAYQIVLNPSSNTFSTAARTPNQRRVAPELDDFRIGPNGGDPRIIETQGALTVAEADEIPGILEGAAADDLLASTNIGLAAAARSWRSLSNRLSLHRNRSIGHHNTRQGRLDEARRKRDERRRRRNRGTTRPRVDAGPASPAPAIKTTKPWVAWFEGSGALGEIESSDAKGYDYGLVGPLIGADTALSADTRVGFAVGTTYSSYETTGLVQNEGTANSVEGIAYGAWLGEPVEALIAARYAHGWVETERRGRIATLSNDADADFEGDMFGFYAELTRGFDLPYAIDLAPLASIAYSHVMWDSFDESGTSPLRMSVEESDTDSAVTSLGFRIQTEREMDEGFIFRPRAKALWNHEWADTEREVSGRFNGATVTGGSNFTVEGAEVPRDHAEISAGWEIGYGANANLFLDWDGRFGSDWIENSLSVGARVAW